MRKLFKEFLLLLIILLLFNINIYSQEINTESFINKTIAEIEVQGNKVVTKEEIIMSIPVTIGDKLKYNSMHNIISELYTLSYFEDIKLSGVLLSESSIKLIIKVKEYPLVNKVTIKGNDRVKLKDIEEVITLKEGDFFSDYLKQKNIRSIKSLYKTEGFDNTNITVESKNSDIEGDVLFVDITINIEEPKRIRIRELEIVGNENISNFSLKRGFETKKYLKILFEINPGVFLKSKIKNDLNLIKSKYYKKGYIDVNVTYEKEIIEETETDIDLKITITIDEGNVYKVNGFDVEGMKLFDKEEVFKDVKIINGDPYNRIFYNQLISLVQSFYSGNGYVSASVSLKENIDYENNTVNPVISIIEGNRSHIQNIYIKGNSKTKDYVILREIMVKEGEVFDADKLRQSLYNLFNTGYFSDVQVEPKQGDGASLIDLLILIEEKRTTMFQFGFTVTPASDNAFAGMLNFSELNLFGRGYNASIDTSFSPNFKTPINSTYKISLGFSNNWFLNKPLMFSIETGYETTFHDNVSTDNDEDGVPDWDTDGDGIVDDGENREDYSMDYKSHSLFFNISFGKRWIPFYSLNFGISFSSNKFTYTSDEYINDTPYLSSGYSYASRNFGESFINNSIYCGFQFSNLDNQFAPTKGIKFVQRLDYFGFWGDTDFIKSMSIFSGNISLPFDFVYTVNSNVSFIAPNLANNLSLDANQYLFISHTNEVRGSQAVFQSFNGLSKMVFNMELNKYFLNNLLIGTMFVDSGMMYKESDGFLNPSINDLVFSFGFGVKLNHPQLPLRLYVTRAYYYQSGKFNVIQNPDLNNWQIVFTIGDFLI